MNVHIIITYAVLLYIYDFMGNMGYFLRGEWYHMHDGYVNYIIT